MALMLKCASSLPGRCQEFHELLSVKRSPLVYKTVRREHALQNSLWCCFTKSDMPGDTSARWTSHQSLSSLKGELRGNTFPSASLNPRYKIFSLRLVRLSINS